MSAKFFVVLTLGILLGVVIGVTYQQKALLEQVAKFSNPPASSGSALESIESNEKILVSKVNDLINKLNLSVSELKSDQNKPANSDADQCLKKSEEIKGLLAEIKEESQRQTAILGRTVGQNVPLKMPDEINDKLSALEKRLAGKESWPQNEKDSQALHKELLELVKNTPSWAEEEILQRLIPLRWEIQFFDLSCSSKCPPEELENRVTEYERLVEKVPDNVPKELQELAAVKLTDAKKELENHLLESAIADGNKALSSETGFSEAIARLDEFDTPEASKLKNQLTSKLDDTQIAARLSSLKRSVSKSNNISDLQLKQNTLMRIAEGALELLQQAQAKANSRTQEIESLGVDCNKKIADCAQTLTHRQEELYASKQRAYQQWALKQIDSFETEFWYAQDSAKKRSRIYGETWVDEDYKKVATAITEHLNPISENLLDRPVSEIYQRSFRRGWEKIEGRQDQTDVAKQCAFVVKKSLAEME